MSIRTVAIASGLVLSATAPLGAQVCAGLPSSAPMSIGANATFGNHASSYGGGWTYVTPSWFGGLNLGSTSYDRLNKSSFDVGGEAAYQVNAVPSGAVKLCPLVRLGYSMGPNDVISGPAKVDYSTWNAQAGVALGTAAAVTAGMTMTPFGSVAMAYQRSQTQISGLPMQHSNDTYGLLEAGLGFTFNRALSFTPRVNIPLGFQGSDPSFGMALSYSFGRR